MKKILAIILTLCILLLCACAPHNADDGRQPDPIVLPTDNNTRTPLRMFMADGFLYYDTGLVSESTPRCGTLDGSFTKTLDAFTTPQNDGECNFEGADGYQIATEITKEVPVGGEWVIFKKIDAPASAFSKLTYCMHITGKISSASNASELLLLSEAMDVTVRDVMEPFFTSQHPFTPKYQTYTIEDLTGGRDKWGLTLTATNVTPTGLTLRFEQLGGTIEGTLQTGAAFTVERLNEDGEWSVLEPKSNVVWNMLAFLIPENDILEMNESWEILYGALPPGGYRITKEIADFKQGHEYKPETYYAYFDITEELCGYPPAESALPHSAPDIPAKQ